MKIFNIKWIYICLYVCWCVNNGQSCSMWSGITCGLPLCSVDVPAPANRRPQGPVKRCQGWLAAINEEWGPYIKDKIRDIGHVHIPYWKLIYVW